MAAPTGLPKHQGGAAVTLKRKRTDTTGSPSLSGHSSKKPRLAESLNLSSQGEIAAINIIEDKYDVQLHSVISSSKIQNRVFAVLNHMGHSPDHDSNGATSSFSTANATATTKPKISVLHAKAADAGKLITVAEIAKRELEKKPDEGEGAAEGRWFQYIALGEKIKERPRDWGKNTAVMGGGRASDSEDDGGFETMKTPFERAIEKRPLIKSTPIISLFLSRVSIEELKKRYEEQTNASPI